MSSFVEDVVPTNRIDPWKTFAVTIRHIRMEAPCVSTIDLAFDDANSQPFQYCPGQFNMLYVPGVGEAAISIAGETSRGHLQHTIRSAGTVTGTIARAGVGMSLGLRGPFGRAWPIKLITASPSKPDLIVVAGGIGLAPLRSLLEYIVRHRDQFGEVSLLLGTRTPSDRLYVDQYGRWESNGIGLEMTVDRATSDWKGHFGVVTLLLERTRIRCPEATMIMTCGPEVMMRYVAKSATGRGIPEKNIWLTLERNMNCAIGLCGHCQLGPEFVCKDGPIFRYDAISRWLNVQEL